MQHRWFTFGDFCFVPGDSQLHKRGVVVSFPDAALRVLALLIEKRARVVSRSELLSAAWPGSVVAPGSLNQAVWQIRTALGDEHRTDRWLVTVRKRGYQFRASVRELDGMHRLRVGWDVQRPIQMILP